MPELAPWLAKPDTGGKLQVAPWLDQAATATATATATAPAPEKSSGSSVADFFRSFPQGVVRGLASTASASGQAEEGLMTGGAQETVPGAQQSAELAGASRLPQPQGLAGRIGGALGEAAGNPLSYLGPGGAVRNTLGAVGGAIGGQLGAELTPNSALGPLAGSVLGGLAGGTKTVAKTAEPASRGAIRDAAEAAYDTIKNSPRKIPIDETSLAAEKIRQTLNQEGFYRESPDAVSVFKTLDRMAYATNASHITPGEIHSITKTLQAIQRANPGKPTGVAAEIARKGVFDYLNKFPELSEAIQVGNANYRAFKTSERIGEAQEKGQFMARGTMTGDNIDPALRQQLRTMYFSKKVNKTPEEKEVLRAIIEGDTASNIAKKFNLLKTPMRHLATSIMHAKGAGVLSHAAQMIVKSIANRNTANKVEELDRLVRRTAPASGMRFASPLSAFPGATEKGGLFTVPMGKSGELEFEIDKPDILVIRGAYLPEAERGKGHGVATYKKVVDWALDNGRIVKSVGSPSPDASRVYESLSRQGYEVNRIPDPAGRIGYSITGKPRAGKSLSRGAQRAIQATRGGAIGAQRLYEE